MQIRKGNMTIVNEDYTKPFCVLGSKGNFIGAKHGYLPPLEDKKMDIDERLEVLEQQMGSLAKPNLTAKQNDTINQLRLDRNHFWEKFNTLKEKVNGLFERKRGKQYKYDK